MIYVTRKAHFNAAHRLHNPEKSDEWNKITFGKCNNPNWHGHNYIIEVTVAGEPDPETGYVIDLSKLKAIINSSVIEPCDHKNLNIEVPFLKNIIPTTENIVKAFYKEMEGDIAEETQGRAELYSVKLYETERNIAEYCPKRSVK